MLSSILSLSGQRIQDIPQKQRKVRYWLKAEADGESGSMSKKSSSSSLVLEELHETMKDEDLSTFRFLLCVKSLSGLTADCAISDMTGWTASVK